MPVYDHDPEEVANLGWEEFLAQQWESIFTGYRGWAGLRKMGRRWCDFIEVGLGCSQDFADELVRVHVIDRPDRDLEGAGDAHTVVAGMTGVIADVGADLASMGHLAPEISAYLLDRHAKLANFLRADVLGLDET
jgi:hypothetical protein